MKTTKQKPFLKKNEWVVRPKRYMILDDTDSIFPTFGVSVVYIFANMVTGEMKFFAMSIVEERGTEAILKELNK